MQGITPSGNPVDDQYYKRFQEDLINSQVQGQPGWKNYDHWYDEVIKQKPKQEERQSMRGSRGWNV